MVISYQLERFLRPRPGPKERCWCSKRLLGWLAATSRHYVLAATTSACMSTHKAQSCYMVMWLYVVADCDGKRIRILQHRDWPP